MIYKSKTSSSKKWAKDDADDDSPRSVNGMCMCYGCPMPGSMNSSTAGPVSYWMCHAHFRSQAGNWATITQRYKNNQREVDLILAIRNAQSGKPFNIKGWLISLHQSNEVKLLPNDTDRISDNSLSMRKWLSRLEKSLFETVSQGLAEEHQVDEIKSSNAIELMNIADVMLKQFKQPLTRTRV